jgi:hypothetical protein
MPDVFQVGFRPTARAVLECVKLIEIAAPCAFLKRSDAWKSELAMRCAVLMRWMVSPLSRLRTTTASLSEGSKFSLR